MKKTLRTYLLNIPPPEGDLTHLQLDAVEKAVREYLVAQLSAKEQKLRKLLETRPRPKFSIIGKPDKDYDRIEVAKWFEVFVREFEKAFSSAGLSRERSAELLGEEK